MKRKVLILFLLVALTVAVGCGSKEADTTPAKTSTPDSVKAYDIAGPWVVKDQPESQYYLTFRPEGTYGIVIAGVSSEGTFMINGDTVRLIDTNGDQKEYQYAKGAEMMQDQLVGEVIWSRQ
ncbi:MAG: hypothetical protein JW738_01710 [Actinobacteria bacterium]|nr:hypothetical protein [Actinomycetota bacterium]